MVQVTFFIAKQLISPQAYSGGFRKIPTHGNRTQEF
jgi:hypothetical protein